MMMMQPVLPPTPLNPPTPHDYEHMHTAYRMQLRTDKTVFACPYKDCPTTDLLSKDYELHCAYKHGLDTRYYCVWCRGAVFFTGRHKKKSVLHLLACWQKFLAFRPPTVVRLRRIHPSPFQELWWDLPDHAYDGVWPVPLRIPLVTFKNTAINPAVAAVRLFLENTHTTTTSSSSSSSHDDPVPSSHQHHAGDPVPSSHHADDDPVPITPLQWFHVTVDLKALTRFLKIMNKYAGRFRTLPHSCWCMLWDVALRHRHWIVMTPAGDTLFLKVITRPMFRSIQTTRITRALDLVNTIGDLSGQRRGCGHNRCPTTRMLVKGYYALEPLPNGYRLPLLMQWDNGLLEDDYYRTRTRDVIRLLGLKVQARMCVSDHFERSLKATEYWLHFIRGEKLYFKHRAGCDGENDEDGDDRSRETVAAAAAKAAATATATPATETTTPAATKVIETIQLD